MKMMDSIYCLLLRRHMRYLRPVNLIEEAIPRIGHLPAGVSIVYDAKSHVHALQFLPEVEDVTFPTAQIFKHCDYFPEEFSLFFLLSHGSKYRKHECIFSITTKSKSLIAIHISNSKLTFTYDNRKVRFRNSVFKDKKWHAVGFSVTGTTVVMTTDCLQKQKRRLKRMFPSFLTIENSTTAIAKCNSREPILSGYLKDIILVPGADVASKACPPRMPRTAFMDNRIPTFPDLAASYSSVGPRWEDCTWMDVGNLAFDVYSHSLKVCVNGIWKQVSLKLSDERKKKLDYLVPYQDIKTPAAAIDVDLFTIPGEGLFAIFANEETRKRRGISAMYKWVGKMFRLYQRLPTKTAQSWCHFTIGDSFYLAVANYGDDTDDVINSTVFKWHRHRKKFREYQSLVTYTARDVEYFQINNVHYLAITNHARGKSQVVDSVIYRWSGRRFVSNQNITTVGAYDWTYFTVDGFHFLAVAQAFDGRTTLFESKIFIFQNDLFIPFQTLETNGATDWEFFTIGSDCYLAVANAYNYGPQNFKEVDTFYTNSTIYKLNRQKRAFQTYQSFPSYSAIDWEHLTIGEDHYLVVSNAQNGGTELQRLSTIYRYQGVDKFVPVHHMHLNPSADWETFHDGEDVFLIYSNAKGRTSQVLKVKFV